VGREGCRVKLLSVVERADEGRWPCSEKMWKAESVSRRFRVCYRRQLEKQG
jgi:hypothetical protein